MSVISTFPNFKSVNIQNKVEFERYIKMNELYSDFNFTSIYTWDSDNSHEFSLHNGNVVLKLADYVTNKPVLSVFGEKDIDETFKVALAYSREILQNNELVLITEQTVKCMTNKTQFSITEDPDNFDYIFSLEKMALFTGKTYKSKRQASSRCVRDNEIKIVALDVISPDIQNLVLEMTATWVTLKKKANNDQEYSDDELRALARVFDHFNDIPSLKLHLAYSGRKLVGFSIDELESNSYVLSHFCKTLPTVKGLTEYFNQYLAESFFNKGYTYWNWEQDTGNRTLRTLKLSYRPSHFNKKYIIKMQPHNS